jgi:hypothetical protein
VAGVTAPVTEAHLRAYYASLHQRDRAADGSAQGTERVRFYRVMRSVLPEDQGRIVRRTLIAELSF